MDYKEIQDLIKLVKKNSITELEIEREDFKISIKSQGDERFIQQVAAPIQQSQPVAQVVVPQQQIAATPPAQAAEPAVTESNLIEVKSPMIGTFYRSPGPDKDPFVGIGDSVSSGDPICIIEAMKLFNEIETEITGKIVKILVEDATPVEYDQPLFLVDPTA